MGKTFIFGTNGGLDQIDGTPTGRTETNLVIATQGASFLVNNPAFKSPEIMPGTPALDPGLKP